MSVRLLFSRLSLISFWVWTEMNDAKSEYSQTDDFQALASSDTTYEKVMEAVKNIVKASGR
jgi:hypothetical protein